MRLKMPFIAPWVAVPKTSRMLHYSSEGMTREELSQHASALAEQQRVEFVRGGRKLLRRFEQNSSLIEASYNSLAESARNSEQLTPGAEWLLDNYHVVQEHVRDIRRHLPRAFYKVLPKLVDGDYQGYPRVYHLAMELTRHSDAIVTRDTLSSFIDSYQTKATLTIGELWAFPIMIRLSLIENLRCLTEINLQARDERIAGVELIESLMDTEDSTASGLLLNLAGRLKTTPDLLDHGVVHLMRYLKTARSNTSLTRQWLEERIREQGRDPLVLMEAEDHTEAVNQISIGNTVTSLKTVSSINWHSWVESVSVVHQVLSGDPSETYLRSDFQTRNACRTVVEQLARAMGRDEDDVAMSAINCVKQMLKERDGIASIPFVLMAEGRSALEKMIGFVPSPLSRLQRHIRCHAIEFYLSSLFIVSAAILFYSLYWMLYYGADATILVIASLVFLIPASALGTNIVQWIVSRLVIPERLATLDLEAGIPDEFQTMVVVHQIFADTESVERALAGLEICYLGNSEANLFYAILADLSDFSEKRNASDDEIIEKAKSLTIQLNQKYPGEDERFFLLFRARQWNESERKCIGWERKRGKLREFNQLILGEDITSFTINVGSLEKIRQTRYVITLDADTQLTRGVARQMIETIAHPLNHAVFDECTNEILRGYAIVQPHIATSLRSAHASRFAGIFSAQVGFDPYTNTFSDVYQDLFKEGSYLGKAVYDVMSFERALGSRVPENALLSHDLFEGIFAKVATATNIQLVDDFPPRFSAYVRRQHRWVRGDWQLLPWIFRCVPDGAGSMVRSRISALGRWKLFDNLRRSLVAPTCFFALVFAWLLIPGPSWFWSVLIVIVIAFPVYANLANSLLLPPLGLAKGLYVHGVSRDLLKQSLQTILTISFLPYEAYLMLHAIAIALFRVYISGNNLLEWETAERSERRIETGLSACCMQMMPGIMLAVVSGLLVAHFAPASLPVAMVFLLLWALSPAIAWWIGWPIPETDYQLETEERRHLRQVAYDTWRYFDDHLTAEYHYLIPDNIQLVPKIKVALRTSPTNLGLSILSTIAAHDLGFISLPGMLERLGRTLESMSKLERFKGHFLNWYDISSLGPLHPRYVSTVDSGNLIGHLIAARAACRDMPNFQVFSAQHWINIRDFARELIESDIVFSDSVREVLHKFVSSDSLRPGSVPALGSFVSCAAKLCRMLDDGNLTISTMSESEQMLLKNFSCGLREIMRLEVFVGWHVNLPLLLNQIELLQVDKVDISQDLLNSIKSYVMYVLDIRSPTWSSLGRANLELHELLLNWHIDCELESALALNTTVMQLREEIQLSSQALNELRVSNDILMANFSEMITDCDFRFLYNNDKDLFAIGYDVDSARIDTAFYDLLASEARLASFVAIAKGEVPQKHWFMLGRSIADSAGGKALISWSATMFEYLMPLLVMKNFPETILSTTNRAVVRAQRAYGRKRGVPWGISESAYSGVNFEKSYQYRAFGVPGLGLKRGLTEDLVISPYSTFLALLVEQKQAIRNLTRLEEMGVRGKYGFYEAIDFTANRLAQEEKFHIVESFLAHHQGMTLVALTNVLLENVFQQRFHSDPIVQATEMLLHERFPDRLPAFVPHQAELSLFEHQEEDSVIKASKTETHNTPHTLYPLTRLYSNGLYSLMVDNSGSGRSFFQKRIALTRWRSDGVSNDRGYYIYVRDIDSGKVWSVTYQPTTIEPEIYEVVFHPDKVEYIRRDFNIGLRTEVVLSPEDNVEIRRVCVTNHSGVLRNIELTSFAEVALDYVEADISHQAFSKMFIVSAYDEDRHCLVLSRRTRSRAEDGLFLMHMIATPSGEDIAYESSRFRFIGRGRSVHNPAVFAEEKRGLECSTGAVLDPIFSMQKRLKIEPGQSTDVSFVTAVARTSEDVLHLAEQYAEDKAIVRAFEMAWSRSNVELRHEQWTIAQTHAFQHLGNAIYYNIPQLRTTARVIARNSLAQAGFWRFGISGDLPIVLLRVRDEDHLKLVLELVMAHNYLLLRGLEFDVVVLNESSGGYYQDLHGKVEQVMGSGFPAPIVEKKGGLFLRDSNNLSSEEITLLESHARVVLDGGAGSLAKQVSLQSRRLESVVANRIKSIASLGGDGMFEDYMPSGLEFNNGQGGFGANATNYTIKIRNGKLPPLPWANVVANPDFGFLVTESGSGYTWCDNSRENKLTPWSNDPVCDSPGEVLYIRDSRSGKYWSPTPLPVESATDFLVTHAFGYSTFESQCRGISSLLTISGGPHENVKWWRLELGNDDSAERILEVFLYVDWTLGIRREDAADHVATHYDSINDILFAQNRYNNEFSHKVTYLASNIQLDGYTTSRKDFIGRNRTLASPYALESRVTGSSRGLIGGFSLKPLAIDLSGKTGAGFEQCGVIKVSIKIAAGGKRAIIFCMGQENSIEEARLKARDYRTSQRYQEVFSAQKDYWHSIVSSLQFTTPNRAMDIMLNGWLLYQNLSCRINGRASFYQCGGAYGYRDQLQDVMSLLFTAPDVARRQILLCASRQFPEGDVQHWWHPPTGRGVRTRITDDYLWLPYVVARYIEVTGDSEVLEEIIPFLEGRSLEPVEVEAYLLPDVSSDAVSLYQHCVVAINRAFAYGSHGLPLIGSGDWNDGMNEVGNGGKGESVWLGWFLYDILKKFTPIVKRRGDEERLRQYQAESERILSSIEENAWD
ncbi:MAG: glucoamylase family protein, partial [bacterium]|nr:glucoamylase family protein [bacterium]